MFTRLRRALAVAHATYRQRLHPAPAAPYGGDTDPEAVAAAEPVKGFEVLEAVAGLPVSTWRYTWEPADTRHLGPMAQDWHAALRLGGSNRRIDTVDGLGVALVCIQALHRRVTQLQAELDTCRAERDCPRETGA